MAEQHDDGATWVSTYMGWEDEYEDGTVKFNGQRLVGILPIKFASDLREAGRDFAWMMNKVRRDRIEQGHYVPVT